MSLVNYVVIELTLNILFFHKMKLQKIKQLLFMAQKLEKPRNPYRRIILATPLDLLYSNCKTWRLPTLFDQQTVWRTFYGSAAQKYEKKSGFVNQNGK